MENSLASYLVPSFLSSLESRGFRFFYDDKHVWDVLLDVVAHREVLSVKSNTGFLCQRTTEYVSGKGYVDKKCDPFHAPIQKFIQDHLNLTGIQDQSAWLASVDLAKFTVKTMKVTAPKNYYDMAVVTVGDLVEIPWSEPWKMDAADVADAAETLRTLCRDDKVNLPFILRQIYTSRSFQKISRFIKNNRWRSSFSATVGSSPNFVFLKSGAIYDYNENKVLAPDLDTYMRQLLSLNPEKEVTWPDYCQHIFIKGLPLGIWVKHSKVNQQSLDLQYAHQFWDQVKQRTIAKMPFLQANRFARSAASRGNLEMIAFDTANGRVETYLLAYLGVQRTFDLEPPKAKMTTEEQEAYRRWHGWLTAEELRGILARPNFSWFGRVITKHSYNSSSLEPITIDL